MRLGIGSALRALIFGLVFGMTGFGCASGDKKDGGEEMSQDSGDSGAVKKKKKKGKKKKAKKKTDDAGADGT